jgi:hypothetical protein
MPPRSLPRLPPRSPVRSAVPGSTPGWAGWLATRASSPGYAGHQGGTSRCNPRCLPAARRQQDKKSQRLPRPPQPTLRRAGGGSDAARRQLIQVPAGCAPTGRRPTIRLTEPTGDITEAGGDREQSPVVLKAFTTARPAEYKSGTAQSGARAARLRARSGVSWFVRSLREAVMSAQPLLGMSAGTRGRPSQPPVPHEDFVHPCGAVPAPSAADR